MITNSHLACIEAGVKNVEADNTPNSPNDLDLKVTISYGIETKDQHQTGISIYMDIHIMTVNKLEVLAEAVLVWIPKKSKHVPSLCALRRQSSKPK